MGLGGEILQEQGIHGALEANVKLGNLTLGEGDDLHASETEVLEQRCHVGLVAGDAVQCLCKHDVELAVLGILQQSLDPGAKDHARA
ncbi:unnamed protein product [uncultured bacterium]|nr:unnamed protein product [uncultured bacterium]